MSTPHDTATSVAETRRAIDTALAATEYSCKTVSWDDVSRGTVNGSLSCWGANITDTYLKAKDGTSLFTVRSDNWNEKLGVVRSEHVALLTGNCETGGMLRNITLKQFLENPAACGATYCGIGESVNLSDVSVDANVSIRFQTVFLPVEENETGRGTMQFAAEAYNYATKSDDNPRNLVLLATTQGLSVQADGAGAKRLLLHAGSAENVSEYWLEAESSRHEVGGEQKESKEEREDALRRGKATSEVIGIKAMGTRFNVLMTIQIPLMQKTVQRRQVTYRVRGEKRKRGGRIRQTARLSTGGAAPRIQLATKAARKSGISSPSSECVRGMGMKNRPMIPPLGQASAARVSRGDFYGKCKGLSVSEVKRKRDESVTVTCVLYNAVKGGVPSERDVLAAVADMDRLYAACTKSGRLEDAAFDFMKTTLTVDDLVTIQDKLSDQIATAHPPSLAKPQPEPPSVKRVIMSKFAEVEGMSSLVGESVFELRLLTMGAVDDPSTKSLLTTKFELLNTKIDGGDAEAARNMLVETKLIVRGALS